MAGQPTKFNFIAHKHLNPNPKNFNIALLKAIDVQLDRPILRPDPVHPMKAFLIRTIDSSAKPSHDDEEFFKSSGENSPNTDSYLSARMSVIYRIGSSHDGHDIGRTKDVNQSTSRVGEFAFFDGDEKILQKSFVESPRFKTQSDKPLESDRHVLELSKISKVTFESVKTQMSGSIVETYKLTIEMKIGEANFCTIYLRKVKDFFKFIELAKKHDLVVKFSGQISPKAVDPEATKQLKRATKPPLPEKPDVRIQVEQLKPKEVSIDPPIVVRHKRVQSCGGPEPEPAKVFRRPSFRLDDLTMHESQYMQKVPERKVAVEHKLTGDEIKERAKMFHILRKGKIFCKYPTSRFGGPSFRRVFFSKELEFICWSKPSSPKVKKAFPTSTIQKIIVGRETPNFQRFPTQNYQKYENSFSIVLSDRSIDLECVSYEDFNEFYGALKYFIKYKRNNKI